MHHSTHKWVEMLKSVGRAERREAHAGPGALLRALRRGGPRRLLRGPRRVARRLDRPRRPGARARRRRARGRARPADPRPPPAHRGAAAHATRRRGVITIERIDPLTDERTHRDEEARAGRGLRPRLLTARRASACCTRSATRTPAARSTRPTCRRGRRRSPTSRTRRASPAAAATASTASTPAGFVAAAYQHRTSRAQDPHLHTHVIVANMAQTPERRQVAGARRRADPQELPARRRLPLPGPAPRRAHPHARRRVGAAAQGHGRAARTSRAR